MRDSHPSHRQSDRAYGDEIQGQGHETTYPQIVAQELGIPQHDIVLEEGDTDTAPYGLGTYASRSTPVAGAATAMAARKIRDKARKIAAHLLECQRGRPGMGAGQILRQRRAIKAKTIQEIAFAAYTNLPEGMEAGLEAVHYYDPPNLTFPFGTYICVVDIDKGTGEVKVRRFIAVDDCGNIINPMIVEGQIHGGLTEGLAIAFMQLISYDESGNVQGGNFMDYLLPTAVETPALGDRKNLHSLAASSHSAQKAWANRPMWGRRRHSSTRWWMLFRTWASPTSTCRSLRGRCGRFFGKRESNLVWRYASRRHSKSASPSTSVGPC